MLFNKKEVVRKPIPLAKFTLPETLQSSTGVDKHLISRFFSKHLNKLLRIEIYLPVGYLTESEREYPLLIFNDGQDMDDVYLDKWLKNLQTDGQMKPTFTVAIYADKHRKFVYGVSDQPDYLERGNKAGDYMRFITTELIPYLEERYRLIGTAESRAIAGFSLGGLMAFDIALSNPNTFAWSGVFSGSFWWRAKGYDAGYTDADRIIHNRLLNNAVDVGQHYWFQTGTLDEKNDRDKDGIIDAIGDTLDIISVLKQKGYPSNHINYLEVEGGQHNQGTWAAVMGNFLMWLWT